MRQTKPRSRTPVVRSADRAERASYEPEQVEVNPDDLVAVGEIVAPWGIRGDLKVRLLTDYPERFVRGRFVIGGNTRYRVLGSRQISGDMAVVSLEGVAGRDAAEAMRDVTLNVLESDLPVLEEETYYYHQIVGLKVVDESGSELGSVADIIATGANDVYVVETPEGELMLPAIEDVVKSINLAAGTMTVELLPGMDVVPKPKPKPEQKKAPAKKRPRPTPAASDTAQEATPQPTG
jgi:16S rRNA processing protein RimM